MYLSIYLSLHFFRGWICLSFLLAFGIWFSGTFCFRFYLLISFFCTGDANLCLMPVPTDNALQPATVYCISSGAVKANRLVTPTYHYAPMLPLLATVPTQYREILYNSVIPLQKTQDRKKGFILLILLLIKNNKTVCIFHSPVLMQASFCIDTILHRCININTLGMNLGSSMCGGYVRVRAKERYRWAG